MLELAVKSLLAYLVGSLVGALVLGAIKGVDIRKLGSGNAGSTNALRTQGAGFGFGVLLIDVGKGYLAARVIPGLPWPAPDPELARSWLAVATSGAAIVGHVYPVWHEFRGGKGAATFLGTVLGLAPLFLIPTLAVWLAVVAVSGYVGLATVCAGFAFPLSLALVPRLIPELHNSLPLLCFGWLAAGLLLWTHRANIARMRAGDEHRAARFWLLKNRAARL
jgi:acyl phosphate:glycerol-3-phosphate acyltransferase